MPKTLAEKQNLLEILGWSSTVKIIFTLALAAILVVLSMTRTLMFDAWPVIYILLPFLVVLNAVLLLLAKKGISWAGRLIYPEIFLNVVVVTLFIHFSWTDHDEFLFLYIMPAFTASLVSLRTLNITFALCIVSYGIEHYFTMTPGSGFSAFAAKVFSGEELSDFFLLFLIIAAIGFQARYYIGRIKEANEKLMGLREEFMYRTVHDLRSPATTIRFILEKYQGEGFQKSGSETVRDDIKTIGGLNANLLDMIEDLLQVAKGEQSEVRMKIEPLGLKNIISPILAKLKDEMAQKEIALDYEPEEIPMVSADSLRLREVFENLLENAVKYNKMGGFLAVRFEKNGNFLTTRIENTSTDSLSPEDLEKFFKPYAQIGRDEEPGTGLGLYIVKKLIEKMGGEVSATFGSSEDKISFHISLPIAANS